MEAYLTFDGTAKEALEFYAQCLGGKVFSFTWGESPMGNERPAADKNKIMHATLEARGHKLMASDAPTGDPFEGHKGFALSVQSKDVKEGEQLFNALSAGGKVTLPFQPTFWAKGFGMLVDKFGVSWMVNCESPEGASH